MLNASNQQMLSHRCNQLQNAITRSVDLLLHLSQMCDVVNMPRWSSSDHERAMYSNTVPWPSALGNGHT